MSSNRNREDKTLHLKTGNIIRKNIWYCGIWNEQQLWSSMQLIQVHKLWTWYSHQELSKFDPSRYQFCQKEMGNKRQRNVSISPWCGMNINASNRNQQLPHLGLPSSSSDFVSTKNFPIQTKSKQTSRTTCKMNYVVKCHQNSV